MFLQESARLTYNRRMGRRKMDARAINVLLPTVALAAIPDLLREREDRSEFLREAVELEIAIRSLDVYPELLGYLTANESLAEFCARAVRQAAQRRIKMLKENIAEDEPEFPGQASGPGGASR